MKKITFPLFAVILLAVFTTEAFSGTSGAKFRKNTIVLNEVNFSVDPRIELFHTMEVLAGVPVTNFIDLDYKQKMAAAFTLYKDHQLFAYLSKNPLYGKLFTTIDGPIWFMLHMTQELDWRKDIEVSEKKNPALDSLRILMKDFCRKSNYAAFFNSNSDLYQISLTTLAYNLPDFDEKNRLMDYCGAKDKKQVQFNVILNFLGWGNFGPRIFKRDGAELYAVISPEKTAIRVPTFDVRGLYKLLWHEFAHSFANPAVEKIQDQFEPMGHLLEPIRESMKAQAYHSWPVVFKEHLTEAIACRMAALKFGEEAADLNYFRFQKGMRWIYLNPLIAALKHYESNRSKYPTLDNFMPEIVKAMKSIQQSDIDRWMAETEQIRKPDLAAIPQIGDIYDKKNILFIYSTAETDQVADRKLKDFMNGFKNRIGSLKEAKMVADTAALKMDLTGYNLSVWGSVKGNKFLEKYMPQIPLHVGDEKVIAENIYAGKGYGILIGWVNPVNPQNMMAVYTGQSPADVVDFNQIINGSGSYHIFQNFTTLRQGNFSRQAQVWVAK
ncbi:DUF4932 domain-containing protein [Pedobacter panaciterrae]|uniref:DUF4932 domain-containing protein n=1 Tax=Pedobacter panaciterrae TaxID=363849 RepID=UPI0025947FFD|nr:DUF4932 domain-containing protein [uncultured Pedobacter sp.]